MGYVRNAVLIHAPVEDVFRITNNVRVWPDLFTEYKSSEVLAETPDSVTFRLTTRPDEQNNVWSWVAQRWTNTERRSTYSERQPSSGPFLKMIIRWWYDPVDTSSTVMTWEQEFTMKPDAPVTEEAATNYLNQQTSVQQKVIKERVEQQCGSIPEKPYRGVIVGRYEQGKEQAITEAFERSDRTELPRLLNVQARHVWVLGDIYMHYVEGTPELPSILQQYASHPLFVEIKAELDTYVKPLAPELYPGIAKEIYHWSPAEAENELAHEGEYSFSPHGS